MSRALKDFSNFKPAPGWERPEGEDDLDETINMHPALREQRAHLVAAGVGQLRSSASQSSRSRAPPRSMSVPRFQSNNPPPRRPNTNFKPFDRQTSRPPSHIPQLPPAKRQSFAPTPQLPGWGNQSLHVHNPNQSLDIIKIRNKGLFSNMPVPRSADRRDPRHSEDYDDKGVGFGVKFDSMRDKDDRNKKPQYRDLDDDGKYIASRNILMTNADPVEEVMQQVEELPPRVNRNFDPDEEYGPPIVKRPASTSAETRMKVTAVQPKKKLTMKSSGAADMPRIDEVSDIKAPAFGPPRILSPTLSVAGDRPGMADKQTFMRLTDPSRDRGRFLVEFPVAIDLAGSQEIFVPLRVHQKDDAAVLARCFRVAFSQNDNWERHLRDFISKMRNEQLKKESQQ